MGIKKVQINPHDIKKFKNLYFDKFGVLLESKEAETSLTILISHLQVIYKPITSRQIKGICLGNENGYIYEKNTKND